ncbi:MAG: OmpA family protein [Bacteriovoracaceae bacterium]|nr:OmpA family protein [Bacteriovoracaceae bacterium]
MKLIKGWIAVILITLLGCSTVKKAPLESNDPQQVVQNIQVLKDELIKNNSDVLAKNAFKKGDHELKEGMSDLKKMKPRKDVLDTLSKSKGYFLEAKKISESRKAVPENILEMRRGAIEKGIYNKKDLKEELSKLDDSLIYESNDFSKPISPKKISKFQKKYQKLEVESIQDSKLGAFKRMIKASEINNAKRLAPKTLREAKNKVNLAENLIGQNPQGSSLYKESVVEANKSVKLLDDVMGKLTSSAKGSSEDTALNLVYQDRKLGNLSDKVNLLQSSLTKTSAEVEEISEDLKYKEGELKNTKSKLSLQEAMDEARKSFKESEANVYQQGDNLIIRLKKINFNSGSARIPSNSMDLLAKVNSIITRLNPKGVEVEGHTDSAGRESRNLLLSNKRAEAVKKYLLSLDVPYEVEARGYGESMPIANNETAKGRSLNRRVDIVVKSK